MEKYVKTLQNIISGIVAFIGGLFGGLELSLKILLILMFFDLFTGWRIGKRGLSAKTEDGGFSSNEMKLGFEKKFFTLIYIVIGYLIDTLVGVNFLGEAIVWFYIAYEIISISENATLLGVVKVPLLNKIVDFLIKVSDREFE